MKKLAIIFSLLPTMVLAAEYTADQYYREGQRYDRNHEFYQAARYYFQGLQKTDRLTEKALGHAYIANSLAAAGLYQSASYFFLQALGGGDDRAIRATLHAAPVLLDNIGSGIFKKYMLRYTKAEQYDQLGRDYYLYIVVQDHLFNQRPNEALSVSSTVSKEFPNYPSLLFMRGTAALILGQIDQGIEAFRECSRNADKKQYGRFSSKDEVKELRNRCIAGVARAYYQARNYVEADRWYDLVEMSSLAWPQIQYERAWNSIARGDYNRALGRLMTYRAPGLSWFRESEVDMLRALSYLQLCIYDDVDKEANFFSQRHAGVGDKVKNLLEKQSSGSLENLVKLFRLGSETATKKIQSEDELNQVMNRFVRSPHFANLAQAGGKVRAELNYLDSIGAAGTKGLGAFLRDALVWRWETAQELGGSFVHDRLSTEYKVLLGNIQTIDIVKLEMLQRARQKLESSTDINASLDVWGQKKRGSLGRPRMRNDQYFWGFNGEFWADELGDYVFALKPECGT